MNRLKNAGVVAGRCVNDFAVAEVRRDWVKLEVIENSNFFVCKTKLGDNTRNKMSKFGKARLKEVRKK